jgi:hypothetical protein
MKTAGFSDPPEFTDSVTGEELELWRTAVVRKVEDEPHAHLLAQSAQRYSRHASST